MSTSSFPLYTTQYANSSRLDINLSYDFFEDARVVAPSYLYKANPYNQVLRYCITYDVMSFLGDLFRDECKKEQYGIYGFIKKSNQYGVFMRNSDLDIIKKMLLKHSPPFIVDYFLHPLSFLIAYYTWLFKVESEVDYMKRIHGFFPIQPYEEGLKNFKDKRELFLNRVQKIIDDKSTHPELVKYLSKWDFYKKVKEKISHKRAMLKELKTTNNESPNLMLIKRRAFNSFYCYLKYTVAPSADSFYKKGSFIKVYAQKRTITDEEAIKEILDKNLYIKSEAELFKLVGGIFQILGLIKQNQNTVDYFKKYQKLQREKAEGRNPPECVEPDGTRKAIFSREEWKKQLKENQKAFSIRTSVSSLKKISQKHK